MFEIFCSCDQLAEELQNKPLEEDERELLHLLSTPHIKVHTHRTHTVQGLHVWEGAPLYLLIYVKLLRTIVQCKTHEEHHRV